MRWTPALCFAATLLAAGCDDAPAAPASDPRADEALAPVTDTREPEEPERDPGCRVEPASIWLEDAPARGTLAVGLTEDAGLLVVMSEDGAVRTRALDSAALGSADETGGGGGGDPSPQPPPARGRGSRSALPGATGLFALERLGDGWLVVARGSCAESGHCLIALRLDRTGAPVGEAITAALPSPLRTARRRATDDRVYVAWSADAGHRGLEIFTTEAGGLGRVRRPLGPEPPSEELPTEILGLAADDDRWAVVWRRGAPEDARSHVHVTTERAHVAVEALHEALVLDAIAFDGAQLATVAGFEFSRPHFLRLAPGATEPADARTIEAGAPPPPPFAERVRAAVEVDAQGLWLRRTNAAADPIGDAARIAEGDVGAATVARREDAFVVAWIAPDAAVVRAAVVRCPPA